MCFVNSKRKIILYEISLVVESFRRMWLLSRKRKNVNDELEMDSFKRKKKRSNEDDTSLIFRGRERKSQIL